MGEDHKELLLIEVANEAQIAAHGVEGCITFSFGRSVAIAQFPEQSLNNLVVGNALVI